jgi:hypothetical protein
MINRSPDEAYAQSRKDLLVYEDSELYRLLSKVPDYYISRTDQTVYGELLRAAAMELGRIEYLHNYDLVGKEPAQLDPVDLKRQYAAPLSLLRGFPGKTQDDQSYKDMILALLQAFGKGATMQSLREVISAYAGKDVVIEEAFKKIGQSGYTIADRNTIRVVTQVADKDFTGVKTLTESLYKALDLAKPAHAGLSLNMSLQETEGWSGIPGSDEHLSSTLKDDFIGAPQPKITAWFLDGAAIEAPLYLYNHGGSVSNLTTPDTRLSPTTSVFTSANIQLSGLSPQSGGSWTTDLGNGTVVKVGRQTNSAQNGYYVARVGAWEPYIAHTGVLSPILKRTWEIQNDEEPIIWDME